MASIPLEERFWQKVDIGSPDDCWEWKAARNRHGYGWFWYDGRNINSQRGAWIVTYGTPSSDLHVCHRCDNRGCCNPAHLFLGTSQDNHRDMEQKGRMASGARHGSQTHPERLPRGERQHEAKLNEAAVRSIRADYLRGGVTQWGLARRWKVHQSTISKILLAKAWRHVK